ncbi:MAG: hypothetical protein ACR2QM_17670 [Longimicrobiales bacterium]
MSGQEKSTLAAIVLNLLVNGFVGFQLVQRFESGQLYGGDGLQIWARTVIWAIPALLVLTVLVHLVAYVLSGDRKASTVVDERDRLFQLRGLAVTTVVAGFGFIATVVALATGVQAVQAFTVVYVGMALADLAGNTVRFLSYRFGG